MAKILISNKMTSQYSLAGYREVDTRFEILVGNYRDTSYKFTIQPKVIRNKNMKFSLMSTYADSRQIGFSINPKINNLLGFLIEINPHNKMSAYYELKEPPIIKWDGFPVQDAYVLSNSPYSSINYGNYNSLIVGKSSRGDSHAYVQFDTSSLSSDLRVKSARFRLYYEQLNNSEFIIERVLESWREYNITYLNQPALLQKVNSEYTNNETSRHIEFDVTDTVQQWIKGISNNGLKISSPQENNTIFKTRESMYSPELHVEYFSNQPINAGNKRQKFSIKARQSNNKTTKFNIDIVSYYTSSDIGFSIFAHDPNHNYPVETHFIIHTNRDKMRFLINSAYAETSNLGFKIAVVEDKISQIPFEISVPDFERTVDYRFSIVARQSKEALMPFIITSNKIYKNKNSNMSFVIDAKGEYSREYSEVSFSVEAVKNYMNANKEQHFIISVAEVRASSLGFSIISSKPNMNFTLAVPYLSSSTMKFNVSARKLTANNLNFEISVGNVPIDYSSRIDII